MSIHRSKGLEFPVCIVSGLRKKFNLQDTAQMIVSDPVLGTGADTADPVLHIKGNTLKKNIISWRRKSETLGEELRVLYVAMMIGAILGGAGEQDIQTVEKIGTDIGIAFQIEDDILDETSTTEELGKPVLSDEKNDKTTFVSLYGIEKAKSEAERLSQDAVGLLSHLPGNTECLKKIIIRLTKRKK